MRPQELHVWLAVTIVTRPGLYCNIWWPEFPWAWTLINGIVWCLSRVPSLIFRWWSWSPNLERYCNPLLSFLSRWLLGFFKFFDRIWISDTLKRTPTFQISLFIYIYIYTYIYIYRSCISLCMQIPVFFVVGIPWEASTQILKVSQVVTETFSFRLPNCHHTGWGSTRRGWIAMGKLAALSTSVGPKGNPVNM